MARKRFRQLPSAASAAAAAAAASPQRNSEVALLYFCMFSSGHGHEDPV